MPSSSLAAAARFFWVTCQVGAEAAVKEEVARRQNQFRFAYSRPGFLTFRLPEDHGLPEDYDPGLVFARASGFSLGPAKGSSPDERAEAAWGLWGRRPLDQVHAWPRDLFAPGEHRFEPAITDEAKASRTSLLKTRPAEFGAPRGAADPQAQARPGDVVLDCILVEAEQWWVGFHRARKVPSRWPGGMMPLALPANAVSRAWLKMEEGLRWSELPLSAGARCAEIGAAPGGASQALLARGVVVLGIDPAEIDPQVLGHPNFTHLRRRANQVRRREFRKIRWLTADMNVAPAYTLDVVEEIALHPEVQLRGLLLTLKLFDWSQASEIPQFLRRIRSWGFNEVAARQLQHNRQEICVRALKRPFVRKTGGLRRPPP